MLRCTTISHPQKSYSGGIFTIIRNILLVLCLNTGSSVMALKYLKIIFSTSQQDKNQIDIFPETRCLRLLQNFFHFY